MNLFTMNLKAGVPSLWPGRGKYFRLLKGAGTFKLEVTYALGGSQSSEMIAGIGVDLRHPESQEPFNALYLTSETDQEVRVLVSSLPTTDSRLTGDVDVNGLLSVVNSGGTARAFRSVPIPAATPTLLLPADNDRLSAACNLSGTVYLGPDNTVSNANGYPSGSFEDSNAAELWAYSVAGTTVLVMESVK